MNKWQKEVQQVYLDNEEKILKDLRRVYEKALADIEEKTAALLGRTDTENLQSIIYQIDYQNALKKQISGILDAMDSEQFTSVSDYLKKCYEDGFIGTMYDLQGQGIPLIMPIDQEQVAKALVHDTKLSKSLYATLGEDVNVLKRRIGGNLSRGIAQGQSYAQIAKNIRGEGNIALNKTMRIARTEGHRITSEATYDAQVKAKAAGADVVKQWDATLDKRTRRAHSELDGQIREMDEPFEYNGHTAMFPGGFGVASLDINCRCALLQRAKWALDEDELSELEDRAKYFDLDKTDSFEDYKKKYLEAVQVVKYPYQGKVFHMNPNGDLVEGAGSNQDTFQFDDITSDEIATADAIKGMEFSEYEKIKFIQNPDGTLTPLTPIDGNLTKHGIDYTGETLSLNDDGTYSFGKVKNAAQYKVSVENNKVMQVSLHTDFEGLSSEEKMKKIVSKMPEDIRDEIQSTYDAYAGGAGYEDVAKHILQKHGYEAIDIIYNDGADVMLQVLNDSIITKTKKSKLETLGASLVTSQKKLAKVGNKTYSGIWKDDVSVSDYAAKKGSIQAKRDYFNAQIAHGSPDSAKYQKYLDDLDEFEKLGKQYEEINAKISKIQSDIAKLSPKTTSASFDGDSYSVTRKNSAAWFTDQNGSTRAADKVYRDKTGEVWRAASEDEKNAVHEYTQSYSKFNEPLRGIEYGTGNYLGVGNVDLDQIGVSYSGFRPGQVREQIDAITSIIDQSSYDVDIWTQRGVGFGGMDKFFGIDASDFNLPEDQLAAKLLGTTSVEHGFMSTAVSRGAGFDSKPIILNIYSPRGTKMIYAEPFSAYGNGAGRSWDGIASQSSFGSEAEMILQRETKFRVTKVEKSNGRIYIDMEVIGQER